MASSLHKVVAEKKEAIEALMETLEKGAEVLASSVGELFLLCEVAAPVVQLVLDNVQSREVIYVKDQFVTVKNKLDLLSTQCNEIDRELRKAQLDSQYFSTEENISNHFRKYMEIIEAKQQYREVKTKMFLDHFAVTGGEKNLFVLYDALMGRNTFGKSILVEVESYVAGDRRQLEDFCVRMKELLCLGLIALLGQCALTGGQKEEEEKILLWSSNMQEIENKMKSSIESCAAAFPRHAKIDAQHLLQEKQDESLQDASRQLLDFLVKKYDWVSWSVRLINHSKNIYRNWRAGEHFHHVAGKNWFEVIQVDNISLVVSYSSSPKPVPQDCIKQLMDGNKGNAPTVVEVLEEKLHGFVVHAISRHKESVAAWSFPEDCHYWERHANVAVCVHSE